MAFDLELENCRLEVRVDKKLHGKIVDHGGAMHLAKHSGTDQYPYMDSSRIYCQLYTIVIVGRWENVEEAHEMIDIEKRMASIKLDVGETEAIWTAEFLQLSSVVFLVFLFRHVR